MLNKSIGNMYSWVDYTWNPIKGKCPHDCSYCYVKRFPQGELRLDERCLKDDLGKGNFIFVGSSCDMFAEEIPYEWIISVLNHCKNYPKNKYLFQTKNPQRYGEFVGSFPFNSILGTTLESNRSYIQYSKAPDIGERISYMHWWDANIFLSLEPLLDFDLEPFVMMIKQINPEFVSIGADSKNHNLPEPSKEKVEALIKKLREFTEVIVKNNLRRLI